MLGFGALAFSLPDPAMSIHSVELIAAILLVPIIAYIVYRYVWRVHKAWRDAADEMGLSYDVGLGVVVSNPLYGARGRRMEGEYRGAQVLVYVDEQGDEYDGRRSTTIYEVSYKLKGSQNLRDYGVPSAKDDLVETVNLLVDQVKLQAGDEEVVLSDPTTAVDEPAESVKQPAAVVARDQ